VKIFNLLGGLILLPLFIVRLLLWPILIGTTAVVVTHFVVKCW
jgi:hypothetical protein